MNSAEVRIRPDSERGVFAIRNIKKGEFICILPIDFIKVGGQWYTLYPENLEKVINFRYGIECDLIIPTNDGNTSLFETFKTFLTRKKKYINNIITPSATRSSYKLSITGVSIPDYSGYYSGHMINDYVSMSFLDKKNYCKFSERYENVKVISELELFTEGTTGVVRLGLQVIAKKNIKKNQELYFMYGVDYWKSYSSDKTFEIMPNIALVN
jgi:hypothetical protein